MSFLIGVSFQKTEGGIVWGLSEDAKTLFIQGLGKVLDLLNEVPFKGKEGSVLSVVLLEGVESVGRHLFAGMSGLTTIDLPVSLMLINPGQLHNCTKLFSISLSENNPKFSSEDGVLFDKEKTHLL